MTTNISFHLDRSLQRLPTDLHGPAIETLDITGCWGLTEVDLGSFSSLRKLFMSDCRAVLSLTLPHDGKLIECVVDRCKSLLQIRNLERQAGLEDLLLDDCWSLQELQMGNIDQLQFLDLRECRSLISITTEHSHELVYCDLRGVPAKLAPALIKAEIMRC